MNKIKEFWGELKYWQRGGVVGLIASTLFTIYVHFYRSGNIFDDYNVTLIALPHIIPLFLNSISFSTLINSPLTITSAIYIILWYSLLGVILGKIYEEVKQKFPKKVTTIFLITFLVFIVVILITNLTFLSLLLAKAA